jgi:hypothetical protein
LGVASSAAAATAPLQAVRGAATHSLPHHQVAFSLPDRFVPSRSVSTNAVMRGSYDHAAQSGTLRCTVRLQAVGVLHRTVQIAKFWGARRLNITNSGKTSGLRWYIGKAGWDRIAYAYASAPKDLATASRRYVVYKMLLSTASPENASDCDSTVANDSNALATAIRSAHTTSK